ncbi:uncharacterized protein LOC143125276 [Alosa pseudoharengus]|uniref:uncharacterized protein LOC143125276 n=1 Tax=Alosa pseudoharengus TaxID=34774 RepID=UPI003F8882D9
MAVLRMRIITLLVIVNLRRKACMGVIADSHKITEVTTAIAGEAITLKCFYPEKHKNDILYWYKQMAGRKPSPVAMWQNHADLKFYDEFKDSRFNITNENFGLHLIISNTTTSDEALYLCGVNDAFELHFVSGTFLAVQGQIQQGSNSTKIIQSPVLKILYQGDSVAINCTILSEMKTEDLRVFWFRAAKDNFHPGVIYTDMNRSSHCERGCSYTLARTNLSLTDTGTYYCAVSACGKILFGNGTVLSIREPVDPLVYGLSVAVGLCVIIIIGMLIYINSKKTLCHHSTGVPSELCTNHDINVAIMNYAALNFSDTRTSGRKKRELQQGTVYTGTLITEMGSNLALTDSYLMSFTKQAYCRSSAPLQEKQTPLL